MTGEESSSNLAPAITFTAIGSGRTFQTQSSGLVLLLLCFAQETRHEVKGFARALGKRLPDASPESIAICHILDLRTAPRLLRGVAEKMLGLEYERAAAELEDGLDPADYVILVPDWDGVICDSLGLADVRKAAKSVVVLPNGEVASRMENVDLEACETLLKQIGVSTGAPQHQ